MKRFLSKAHKYIFIVVLSLFIMGGLPLEYGEEAAFYQGFLIEKPVIRIGLGVNLKDVDLSSSSGMKIFEVKNSFRLIAEDVERAFVKGHQEKLTERFWVQVGQDMGQDEAEDLAQMLRVLVKRNVVIKQTAPDDPARGYRVKIGEFLTRGDAVDCINKLSQSGTADTWILREDITRESKPFLVLADEEPVSLKEDTTLYFVPGHSQSYLSYNGRDYHGIFILQASYKGLVLINLIHIEDYLKSVVPSELSPHTFPEIEAHKAQAVAARTYAIKNLDSHSDLGFDLDDTPKSQYYKGMSAEHPLSSKAVDSTRGQVAHYKGTLIDALYTSTCGGMTEDVENIFEGPALPYLRSTECVYEKQQEWLLESQNTLDPITVNGRNVSGEIASLMSHGVISQKRDPLLYMDQVSVDEALPWIQRAAAILGRKPANLESKTSSLTFLDFSELVVNAFGWKAEVINLLQAGEKDLIKRGIKEVDDQRIDHIAYLVRVKVIPSIKEINDPQRPLLRGELAYYLCRALNRFNAVEHRGVFKHLQGDLVVVETGKKEKMLPLSSDAFLLEKDGQTLSFSKNISLLGGEQVGWIEREGMIRYMEVIHSVKSNVLDRYSDFHSWRVRISRSRLERRINKIYPVGKIIDLSPLARGSSKRITELLVTGSEASVVINGLKIRNALGVKDTLFVIDREYDSADKISHFIFTGRGWGHGVGLCQVGAFGMAQAGAEYQNILKKYYQGITIEKAY